MPARLFRGQTLWIANVVGIHAGDKLPAGKTNGLV
jgi:hypothetical protein